MILSKESTTQALTFNTNFSRFNIFVICYILIKFDKENCNERT